MNRPQILIAGIGNIFHGDDAFGSETARRLDELNSLDGVRVVDFGIRGIDLAYALAEKCDAAIFIDAIPQRSQPGTLHLLEINMNDVGDNGHEMSLLDAHALDPWSVLRAVKSMSPRVRRIYLVGCEPAVLENDEDGMMGLSPAVEAAVPQAVEMVKSLIVQIQKSEAEHEQTISQEKG